jgi:glycerophosphoryl diester phosphodiesterase
MALVAINNPAPGAEAKVLKEISRAKVRQFIRLIAFDLPGLRRIRLLDTQIPVGLHFAGRPPAIRQATALGAEVLLPHWKATSPSLIRRAHLASMLVIPWTVDSPCQMRRTILEGADGIITNYPAKLTQTLARLQKTAL